MRLTRKYLSALGIDADKIDEIIEAHMETVNALKSELDDAKANSGDAEKVKAERDALAEEVKTLKAAKSEDDSYKEKYEALKDEYKEYKDGIKAKETKTSKVTAYKKLLSDVGISEKRLDAITRVADLSKIELDENGAIKDADTLAESLKTEWEDFIETKGTKSGTGAYNPPKNTGKMKSKEEILAIKDTAERQRAIAENIDLFN